MADPTRGPRGRGVLIAVEGIDGTGKSTQIERLAARLRGLGHDVVPTREPTTGPWGAKIRALAREGRERVPPEDELDWFMRDRMEHVEQVIRPALAAGKIVLTDRYYFSTMAYQGALGIDPGRIREMNESLFPRPDLVILLRARPALGLERIARDRAGGADRTFEQARYLEEVAALFERSGDPAVRAVDASGTREEVEARIWREILPILSRVAGERAK
jgi:dTMP kinase